jgi:hypothetical protein
MDRRRLVVYGLLAVIGCGGPRAISDSGSGAFEAGLAPLEDSFAVAWQDNRNGNAEIYLRVVEPTGRPTGPAYRLTHDDVASYAAEIATFDDQIVVAWYERQPSGPVARLGSSSRDGRRRWLTTLAEDARNPVVATHAGLLFCAWVGGTDIWAGWWDRDGRNVSAPALVGEAAATTWNLNAVVDRDGTAYVVYDAIVETAVEEIWIARIAANGTTLSRATSDDGFASTYPDITIAGDDAGGDRAAVTWFDERDSNKEVYLKVGPILDVVENIETGALRITETPGESIGAYLTWNADRLRLTWSDDSSGTYEVFLQLFDKTGAALASPT